MGLGYDQNSPFSMEAPALHALAARLSECTALQALNNDQDAAATLAKISICSPMKPWEPDASITRDQLENELLRVQLAPTEDPFIASVKVGDPEGAAPHIAGSFFMGVWRVVTLQEKQDYGEQGCYLGFLDKISGVQQQLHIRADAIGSPIIKDVIRHGAPKWESSDAQTSIGPMLWAMFEVPWGDRGGRGEE